MTTEKFKTFPYTPDSLPARDYHVANKKYVDNKTGYFVLQANCLGSISTMQAIFAPGKNIIVEHAQMQYLTTTASGSFTGYLYKNSISTLFASSTLSVTTSAGLWTSVSLTSTSISTGDIVCFMVGSKGTDGDKVEIIVRYRDK